MTITTARNPGRIAAIAGAGALGIALLAGCVNVNVSAPSQEPSAGAVAPSASGEGHMMDGHSMDGDSMGSMMDESAAPGGMVADMDPDTHFLQMMIPHHQQAVEMSALAMTNGASPEVLALAEQIASAQGPEITQMEGWLAEAGEPLEGDAHMDMGAHHDMAMDGMLTGAELSALQSAQGADFDRLYLTGMIGHHEGAIIMAEHVKQAGDDPRVAKLADAIIAAQRAEIAQMKQMLGQDG